MKDGDTRNQTEVAVFSFLERGLAQIGLSSSSDQISQLTELVSLLEYWASRINLTGHREPLEMAERLVLDAAALSRTLPEIQTASSLADLGSGAGFPGLPLAILNPHLQVYLVDARQKRIHFQREVRRRLGLERVESLLGRSDELESIPCDIVVAQAMTKPERALELMLPWSREEGLLALPASDAAMPPPSPAMLGPLELRTYTVPSSGVHRKLWVGERRRA